MNSLPLLGMTLLEYESAREKRPAWLDFKLSTLNYSVGDLVTYTTMSWNNGMTIFRIVKDCPQRLDAVWGPVGTQRKSPFSSSLRTQSRNSWVKPGTRTEIPKVRLRGCVEIVPVCQLFPGPYVGKKTVQYSNLYRLRKIDVLELGKGFAKFQQFIHDEIGRIKGA